MGTEPTKQPEPRVIEGDYRISRSHDGIKIEVLDYHADPLLLTDAVLKKLGITFAATGGDSPSDQDH